jgi:hypothetical protein
MMLVYRVEGGRVFVATFGGRNALEKLQVCDVVVILALKEEGSSEPMQTRFKLF